MNESPIPGSEPPTPPLFLSLHRQETGRLAGRVLVRLLPPSVTVLTLGLWLLSGFVSHLPLPFWAAAAGWFAVVLCMTVTAGMHLVLAPLRGLIQSLEAGRGWQGEACSVALHGPLEIQRLGRLFNQTVRDRRAAAGQQDRLDRTIDSMGGIVVVATPEGVIEKVNRSGCLLLGYGEDEIRGRTLETIFLSREGEAADHRMAELRRMTRRNEAGGTEKCLRTREGSSLPVVLSCSPVRDPRGLLESVVCVAQDVSSLKTSEENLRKSLESLKEEVREERSRSRRMHGDLLEKDLRAGMTDLSGMLLHNIGNILTPAKTYTELLDMRKLTQMVEYLDKSFQELMARRGDLHRFIHEEERGEAVLSYINRLMGSLREHTDRCAGYKAKIEVTTDRLLGSLNLQREISCDEEAGRPTDVNALVGVVGRLLEGSLSCREIELRCDLEPNLPWARVDRACLLVILARLIQGSYRALEKSAAMEEKRTIHLRTAAGNGLLSLEIHDNRTGGDAADSPGSGESPPQGLPPGELHRYRSYLESTGGVITFSTGPQGQGMSARLALTAAGAP